MLHSEAAALFFEGKQYRVNQHGKMTRHAATAIIRNHAPELREAFGMSFRTAVVSGAAVCRWILFRREIGPLRVDHRYHPHTPLYW